MGALGFEKHLVIMAEGTEESSSHCTMDLWELASAPFPEKNRAP
jgi:hypothetical protein